MSLKLPDLQNIESAAETVYAFMQASPQLSWPLLNERCGGEVWVKHENHNPTGAFKVRGGLTYIKALLARQQEAQQPAVQQKAPQQKVTGLCAATRGNHGQSIAYAASRFGLSATLVVPQGNSPDKNAAMQALGAELIIEGTDFDESLAHCEALAAERNLHLLPPIASELLTGVATCTWELFSAVPDLDCLYVPIGVGSGICAALAAKKALGLDMEIIGVVSTNANTYQLSFEAGKPIATNSANTLADGLAVRNPSPEALAIILEGVSRIVAVTDEEVQQAIGIYFSDTHNVAEGAGAAPLAALLQDGGAGGKKAGLILTGGNINEQVFRAALETASA